MIEKSALEGYNRTKMIEAIETEYEVSKSKATFLARQETSLFMSDLRDNRYQDAGIDIYQWLTSADRRVVGTPGGAYPEGTAGHGDHFILNHKYCKFSDDSVYADTLEDVKNNKWKTRASLGAPETRPGIQFQCRCIAKPVIL
jgi:uncharacterized protein with gpF-like domain